MSPARTATPVIRYPRLTPDEVLVALDQRLTAAAEVLIGRSPDDVTSGAPGAASARLLPQLVAVCADPQRRDACWLVLTAAFAAFPSPNEVLEFGRMAELAAPGHAETTLLAKVIRDPQRGRLDLPMRVVADGVVVEVDFCARNDAHTGIQRVVRETMPRWNVMHDVTAVAWAEGGSAFRTLDHKGTHRVFAHAEDYVAAAPVDDMDVQRPELIVPWRSSVVLVDVVNIDAKDQLAGLARFSGNTLSMIGYDLVPLTSAETRPIGDADTTVAYLSILKYADRVAGISRSAVAEFAGFTHSLRAQGLPGPEIREVRLVTESLLDTSAGDQPVVGSRPVMLCVGTHEPHKNQRAALHAAERLWREGLDFEVRLVGRKGWSTAVLKPALDRLVAAGRPIRSLGRVSDAELLAEMRGASFVYFASLHEGYGLPVTESLACGTPVITSNFGSQAEIGEAGGCLLVDPRDDDDITRAIRTLLTDPGELARLRAEAASLPVRTWDEYASDLWAFVHPTKDVDS
jgi:glycosyltransferase involved in cell wall biosynthesis